MSAAGFSVGKPAAAGSAPRRRSAAARVVMRAGSERRGAAHLQPSVAATPAEVCPSGYDAKGRQAGRR